MTYLHPAGHLYCRRDLGYVACSGLCCHLLGYHVLREMVACKKRRTDAPVVMNIVARLSIIWALIDLDGSAEVNAILLL
jgi:hypothetical protein